MNAPIVSIGKDLRGQLASPEPVLQSVELSPSVTGFAAPMEHVEAPAEAPAPQRVERAAPAERVAPDERMQKVIAQAQQLQQERNAWKREQETRSADLAELQQYRELKGRAKDDPVAVAEMFGYKPDEYATVLMEKGTLSPERRKILEQQKELNDLKSWRQEVQTQQQQQHLTNLHQTAISEMRQFAEENVERFDLVHRTGAYDKVLERVQRHYIETNNMGEPEVLDYDTAFADVEAELEALYAPVIESPKFRKAVPPAAEPRDSAASSLLQATRKPVGTISSKMRAQSVPPRQLSEQERFQKAGELLLAQMYRR